MPRAIEARGWKREPPPIVATVGGGALSDGFWSETVSYERIGGPFNQPSDSCGLTEMVRFCSPATNNEPSTQVVQQPSPNDTN